VARVASLVPSFGMATRRFRCAALLCLLALTSLYVQYIALHSRGGTAITPPPPPPIAAAEPLANGDRGCPAAYIYNQSQALADPILRSAFGSRLSGARGVDYLYDSNQHGLGSILLTRYLDSAGRCRVVRDPKEAQIFIVPLLIKPIEEEPENERNKVWEFMPPAEWRRIQPLCERLMSDEWPTTLPYLNERTAPRHIFVPLTFFEMAGFCEGGIPAFQYMLDRNRTVARLLARFPRISNDPIQSDRIGDDPSRGGTYGRQLVITAPLVSSVHLTRAQRLSGKPSPWALRPEGSRDLFMSYGGSLNGEPHAVEIRKAVARSCIEYHKHDNTSCILITAHQFDEKRNLEKAFEIKRRSIFCLEPPGYGPHRKSQVDALTLGCIPVMFMPRDDRSLWPLHWGPFRSDSRVLLDGEKVADGTLDVLTTLKAIPKARVQEMQRTIATLGHRMHYGLEDTPNDALEILLNTITDHADVVDKGNAAREGEALYNKELDSPLPRAKDCEDLNLRSRLVETWPESRLRTRLLELALAAQAVWQAGGGDLAPAKSACRLLLRYLVNESTPCTSATLPASGPFKGLGVLKRQPPTPLVSDLCARSCGLCPGAR